MATVKYQLICGLFVFKLWKKKSQNKILTQNEFSCIQIKSEIRLNLEKNINNKLLQNNRFLVQIGTVSQQMMSSGGGGDVNGWETAVASFSFLFISEIIY